MLYYIKKSMVKHEYAEILINGVKTKVTAQEYMELKSSLDIYKLHPRIYDNETNIQYIKRLKLTYINNHGKVQRWSVRDLRQFSQDLDYKFDTEEDWNKSKKRFIQYKEKYNPTPHQKILIEKHKADHANQVGVTSDPFKW